MSETIHLLVEVTLLLVIIWLVASIRQSILNTPAPMTRVRRVVRRAIGQEGNVITSRKKQPLDSSLAPLDTIHPDTALEAIEKYFEDNKQ